MCVNGVNGTSYDKRFDAYCGFHKGDSEEELRKKYMCAHNILLNVIEHLTPKSVLDVGCGAGSWLLAARDIGIQDIYGIDGPWLDKSCLRVSDSIIRLIDLEKSFDLNRTFDLVICIEVAEHLKADFANQFIKSLVRHSNVILFSAAIPYQGGQYHLNEQWQSYWARIFSQFNYIPIDFIRSKIWYDTSIYWWLRQNIILFVKTEYLEKNKRLFSLYQKVNGLIPLDIAHPEAYTLRLNGASFIESEYKKLINLLSSEGIFIVKRDKNNQLMIKKNDESENFKS